jgi:hypothetical protein
LRPVNKVSDLTAVSTATKATVVSSCLPDKSEARTPLAAVEGRKEENTEKGKVSKREPNGK